MANYDEFFESLTPVFYDEEEHQRERVAERPMQLEILARLRKQYNIAMQDITLICQLADIPLDDFMNYSEVPA